MSGTILVVDDDAEIRQLLSMMLNFSGYEAQVAADGMEAWRQIQRQRPDLLILDVMMPELDGISLCRKLREENRTADLPIIMLSGKAHPEAVEEGLNAGADRYMTKPMAMDELTREMKTLLVNGSKRRLEV
jgi:DNA-binding response OmpR family regulator